MNSVRRIVLAGAALGLALAAVATDASAANKQPQHCDAYFNKNLILNPGAEDGPGADDDTVVPVPYWKQTGGFTAAQYAWDGGDLSPTTPGPKDRGKNYFYGGPDAARSTGTQVCIIPKTLVSSGKTTFVLTGWLGGFSDQGDDATLNALFENSAGAVLASAHIGPVTAVQRHDQSELLFRATTGTVPSATRQVEIQLVMIKYVGSDNDGLADNLALVFPGEQLPGH